MIKIENTEVVGWTHAIRGMRNPYSIEGAENNSWDKSDSIHCDFCQENNENPGFCDEIPAVFNDGSCYIVGPNDHDLMMRLANGGPVHAKYRRMITVYVDITAPLYWWKEFDTYKVGTVANSCSTMHKIAAKKFTLEDFSWDQLLNTGCDLFTAESDNGLFKTDVQPIGFLMNYIIPVLNTCREKYLKTKDKKYWWQMIQLLPSSYNQKRTVMLNYEVLAGIYPSRKDHRLDEWHTFCDWIKSLPYSDVITGKD